jgi:hypothetical protein
MEEFISQNAWLIPLLVIWVLPWKGVALWKAAKNNHKTWFIVLLVLNSLAILEIIYIFVIAKKSKQTIAKNLL